MENVLKEMEIDDFIARPYQTEILEVALKENTIIYLPTGAGKTFIAIMLINRLSYRVIQENKKSFVLVNTVPLVEQHSLSLKRHSDLDIGQFSSEQNVDFWTKDQWLTQLDKYQVYVMTAQIFLDIIRHGYFGLDRVNLIIFDECHQAVNDQPMRQIMQLFENVVDGPRVLGLTATLLNGNCSPSKVMDEVRSLETTFHGKVATIRNLSQVTGFSTNPQEKLLVFHSSRTCENISKVINIINNLVTVINDLKFSSKKMDELNQEKLMKPILKILKSLIIHIHMFGIFGGSKATLACIVEFERMKRRKDDKLFDKVLMVVITQLTLVLKLLNDILDQYEKIVQIIKFSTPQVLTLIEILRSSNKENSNNFCGIVFVKQRFTAKILHYVIRALTETDPNFSFIQSNFIVGFSAGNTIRDTRESYFSSKINKKIINNFRNNEINLLIASNVLEEGLDIPRCTLVVKFDKPMDYRSYIQSKGRARHSDSSYIILVPNEEKEKYCCSYKNFKKIEQILQEFLVGKTDNREIPTQYEIKTKLYDDLDAPTYYVDGSDSAHVAAVSAISLLNRYCQTLYNDRYIQLAPNWYTDYLTENGMIKYVTTIEMPILCPLRDKIVSLPLLTKTAAKRSAALEVCKQLHQLGELTNRLLPKTPIDVEYDFDHLFQDHWLNETDSNKKDDNYVCSVPGTRKFIRKYKITIPKCLSSSSAQSKSTYYYLHPIRMVPDNSWDKLRLDVIFDNLNYAILTRNPLPKICQFPIFVSTGSIHINILSNYKQICLDQTELDTLKMFNYFIYFNMLNILHDFLMFDNAEDFGFMIIVPIRNDVSDVTFDIATDIIVDKAYLIPVEEPSLQDKINLNVTKDLYLGKIVQPWYRYPDPYIVLNVCKDSNPLSPFPDMEYKSFEQYYNVKHNQTICNHKQSMLLVKRISNPNADGCSLKCILPHSVTLHGVGKKRNREALKERFEEHFIPELCVLQKYPGSLWVKANYLPTILYRVFRLLQTEELRLIINAGINLPDCYEYWQPLPVDNRILHPEENKRIQQLVQQRNVSEVDATAILPSTLNHHNIQRPKSLTNKDYTTKMLEEQYLWKDEEEPVDIDRNLETVTLMQIADFERFTSERYCCDDMEKVINSPKISKYPALTMETRYEEKPIEMLGQTFNSKGPEQWVIYQCLTTQKANDIVNFERLETLGDSFLKLVATLFLYLEYPDYNEGRLTLVKGKLIGNRNLLYCGLNKDLGSFMKVSEFAPKTDWLPPTFCVPPNIRNQINNDTLNIERLYKFQLLTEEQQSGVLTAETYEKLEELKNESTDESEIKADSSLYTFVGYQVVQDKTVADCVEALIGAYLQSNGLIGGLSIIGWLDIIPASFHPTKLFQRPIPSPLVRNSFEQQSVDDHIPSYAKLEANLGYKFNNRAFLLQALTHASYSLNHITNCYQRLEFLGDAVLDFLITSHIFEIADNLTPGQLTDLRSALVNNITFAALVARNGFHKHLKFINKKLMDIIDIFVEFQEQRNFNVTEETLILVEEHPMYIAENVYVPKVLGDLFESLAGAVFLDSGMSLETTWKVFYRLMWHEIEMFRINVPKSPVRLLYENVNAAPKFEKVNVVCNNVSVITCSVMVSGKKHEVHGFGENKKQAKRAAAKMALRLLTSDRVK